MNGDKEQDMREQTLYIRQVGTQGRSALLRTALRATGDVLVHRETLREDLATPWRRDTSGKFSYRLRPWRLLPSISRVPP